MIPYYSDNDIDVLCNTEQKDLNEVSGWCCFNKLKVNAAKMKAMFFYVRSTGTWQIRILIRRQ